MKTICNFHRTNNVIVGFDTYNIFSLQSNNDRKRKKLVSKLKSQVISINKKKYFKTKTILVYKLNP